MAEGDEIYSQNQENSTQSQPDSPSSSTDTYLVGFVIANIVGVQHYSGRISGREMVGLVREPLNPYDENAIKVLNTRNVQVGHIEKTVASVISPMIDTETISVEGIVPNSRSCDNCYKIPCQVHVFSRMEHLSDVKTLIIASGLQLISDSDVSFTLSAAMAVKETAGSKGRKGIKSVDQIFDMVDKDVSKRRDLVALEPPKNAIKSELFVHQKEGLGWLVHRENSDELPPFWEKRDRSFVNVLTNYKTDNRPEPLRGGIFADDMGLGKTLTLLSLIAFDKYRCPIPLLPIPLLSLIAFDKYGFPIPCPIDNTRGDELDEEFAVSGGKKGKRGRPKKNTGSQKKSKNEGSKFSSLSDGKSVGGVDKSSTDMEVQTTLVVCPPSVFSTWVKQLEEHTVPGTLRMCMYYGDRRTVDAEELKTYDIVLTTYTILATENASPNSPMKMLEWRRVILDEAHIIKNSRALQSQAVCNLKAKRRWVVTGTPIQNGSYDLFSLIAFLHFEPFSVKSYWKALVQRPLTQGMEQGLKRLQVLMATISLRRTKDKGLIELPSKTVETHFVDLSKNERELYDKIEGQAKNILCGYIEGNDFLRNYSTILSIILRLRQICTDMTLCPSDLGSLFSSSNIEDVSNNPELLKKLVEVLQDGEDIDCPICISSLSDIVITCCAHIFCRACILKTLKRSRACCPLCRRPLSESDLFSAPPESSETKDDAPSSSEKGTSSKVSALLELLLASKDQNSSRKSVVFSQFQKMLVILEGPLKAAGFKVLRIDGKMNAKKRAQVIEEFSDSTEGSPMVLLASLQTSSAGINLTAASRVYLFEPWWNPAVEEQAMDRVHRIGQKENVKIVRLIVRNSIEERILKLQEKKKEFARDAFGKRSAKSRREVSQDDMRALMSL